MAVPAVVADELVEEMKKELPKLEKTARRLGELFADQFGLTQEHDYIGWRLLLILGVELYYNKLRAPLKTAHHLETQLVGLVEAAYRWLSGGNPLGAFGEGADAMLETLQNATPTWLSGISTHVQPVTIRERLSSQRVPVTGHAMGEAAQWVVGAAQTTSEEQAALAAAEAEYQAQLAQSGGG